MCGLCTSRLWERRLTLVGLWHDLLGLSASSMNRLEEAAFSRQGWKRAGIEIGEGGVG